MTKAHPNETDGALHDIRILDLSRFIAGPYCAMILGDMGAEVIKIEKPGDGDPARTYYPQLGGRSVYSMMFNRNKRGVGLDLRSSEGLASLRALIAKADVLIENFRPGTMEKMGLGWEEVHAINPRLVMARISGFGQDGPWAQLPAFDGIAQAMSGLMDLTGSTDGPPTVCGTFICDYATGMYAAMGVLAAIRARDQSGKGQVVDVSLLDSAASLLMSAIPEFRQLGLPMKRRGNRDRYSPPTNAYETSDGEWVLIVCGGVMYFPRLAAALQQPELIQDPRFVSLASRRENWDAVEEVVRRWALQNSAADVVARLRAAEVPCGKVATIAEIATNEQLLHRGQIVEIDDPVAGKISMQGVTIKLSGTPLSIRRPMPEVGQHTQEVLDEWLSN